MADIDVVKKGSRAWLWILLLLVLAIVVWMAMAGNNPNRTGQMLEQGGQPLLAAALVRAARAHRRDGNPAQSLAEASRTR